MAEDDIIHVAKLKKGDDTFEIVVDPDLAIEFQKKKEGDITSVLKSHQIFADAKKGMAASADNMKARFGTDDELEVAKTILLEGDIQLSAQYREKLRQEKKKRILDMIVRNAVDPKTNVPHPRTRIENAFDEAKIKIDEYKGAEAQIQDILKEIRKVLPIKLVVKEIEVIIPPEFAAKAYGSVTSLGKIKREEWRKDGSWLVIVEVPGGLETDFYDRINNLTHGKAEAKVIQVK